ncbi:hypothetical protein JX266_005064 [Neoarthrinium moseri]|nr:hypothetical protein JX266_005064 [Neoarthrinium moseri]
MAVPRPRPGRDPPPRARHPGPGPGGPHPAVVGRYYGRGVTDPLVVAARANVRRRWREDLRIWRSAFDALEALMRGATKDVGGWYHEQRDDEEGLLQAEAFPKSADRECRRAWSRPDAMFRAEAMVAQAAFEARLAEEEECHEGDDDGSMISGTGRKLLAFRTWDRGRTGGGGVAKGTTARYRNAGKKRRGVRWVDYLGDLDLRESDPSDGDEVQGVDGGIDSAWLPARIQHRQENLTFSAVRTGPCSGRCPSRS